MNKVRDLERTREALMKAGLAEFSAKGLAGARTEAIAKRAGVNKRMLFYCFGSKARLYLAILKRKLAEKARVIQSLPEDLVEGMLQMYDAGCADQDWVRMLEWEALSAGKGGVVAQAERRSVFELAIAKFERLQKQGGVAAGADLRQLFVSILGISFFPLAFPQMTELATGLSPTDPSFRNQRREFLRWIGERLRGQLNTTAPAGTENSARGTPHAA